MPGTIYSIGEALIDFIPNQHNCHLKDVMGFKRVMGGAPANVAVSIAKLGGYSSFISKLGEDAFGDHIVEQLVYYQVEREWLIRTNQANTGLAFVSLNENGERDFSFYRNPSADMLLSPEEVSGLSFQEDDVLHFGSVDLIDAPVKEAHLAVIKQAEIDQALISFDPNVRLPLWDSAEACRSAINQFIPHAHVLKISDEELQFITGMDDEQQALQRLFIGNVQWVVYTRGRKGAVLLTKTGQIVKHSGYQVKPVDTTGAGDAFVGALLYQLQEKMISLKTLNKLSEEQLQRLLAFSNGYAALTTLKNGAVESLPTHAETLAFMANY
ncbi:fructokinase [Amphibacillus marinus]|uniref:Fructokinase n=1 Tax=Amphibacillus marinus TaxID=872970 RepID=A0A1H8Q6Y5_9BACI|nr:carbohydrate kinase [Amphibacillus marinus]SEO49731.1 fructokinase [Amphibacillus marinus]